LSDLTTDLKAHCRSRGADLVGVAPLDRFEGVPPQNDPRAIFPDATALVVIGRRITRGTLRGWEEGTNRDIYEMFGYSWLDRQFLALTTCEATEWLEDRGWEATPVMSYPPETPPQTPMAAPRLSGANTVAMMLSVDGIIAAPPMPWMTRKAISR